MADSGVSLLQGSLDGLVLKTLSWEPMHGFGIARWIRQRTDDALNLEEGSLYPALYRMEARGWIKAEWRVTEKNRRAQDYQLTAQGRRPPARGGAPLAAPARRPGHLFAGQPRVPQGRPLDHDRGVPAQLSPPRPPHGVKVRFHPPAVPRRLGQLGSDR